MIESSSSFDSGYRRTNVQEQGGKAKTGFLTGSSGVETAHVEIVSFVEDAVHDAGADGVVVAMSGGIDSTLTAALAVEALGSDRVLGLGLPYNKTDACAVSDARTMAEGLGIEFHERNLRPLVDDFEELTGPLLDAAGEDDPTTAPREIGNAVARLRMTGLYYAANGRSLLVLGTANRSELLLGYFTKYGDGAADLYPIGDLYKTEVWALAKHLGLPKRIVGKDPTAGFWAGQTDAAELGASYDVLDPLLHSVVDRGERAETVVDDLGVDPDVARDVLSRYGDTDHKRTLPPTPGVGRSHPQQATYRTESLDRR